MKKWLTFLLLLPSVCSGATFLQSAHDHLLFSANTTYYIPAGGITVGFSAEVTAQVPFYKDGTFSKAWMGFIANSITAGSTITLRVNGADTSIVMHPGVSSAAAVEDIIHTTHISAGDKVNWKLITGATGVTMEPVGLLAAFSSDTDSTIRMITTGWNGTSGQTNGFADFYVPLANNMGNGSGSWVDQSDTQLLYVVQSTITVSHLAAYITNNARTVPISIRLFKNRAATALAMYVPITTTGLIENTTSSVSLFPGDTVYYQIGTSAGSDGNLISASFISAEWSTTDGTMEYPVTSPGKGYSAGADDVTTFFGPSGVDSLGSTYQIPARSSATVSLVHYFTSTNTLTGTFDIYLRANGNRLTSTIHVPAGAWGNFVDRTHSDVIVATDTIDYELVSAAGTGSTQLDALGAHLGPVVSTGSAASTTDPLSAQFYPSIDTTPSDYYTPVGTITVTDSLYKVFKSSTAPGDVHWAIVYSMINETQSFQVHVSPSVNITSLTVTVSSLTNIQTGTVISSASTDIVVYREFYLSITTPTALSTTTYVGGFRASMPDILIPTKDPYYHQTTNAFPVAVTAGNTQSTWVDVHVPTSAPSGYYSGHIYVSSGSVVVSTMPVIYAVWAWQMPSTSTLGMIGAGFGYNGFNNVVYGAGAVSCGYPGAAGASCDAANVNEWIDGSVQMLDNRWTIDTPNYIYPNSGSFATYISSIGPLINGTTGNATITILPGAALTKVGLSYSGSNLNAATWQNWATNFNNQGWFSRLFNYPCDEPAGATWGLCVSSMTSTRSYSVPIVPNQVTANMANAITNGATNYIDWITPIVEDVEYPGLGNLRSTYDTWLATSSLLVSRKVGSYQDCESAGTCSQGTVGPANTPTFPNRHIDGVPVANRAFETWLFLNNFSYELYFAVDACDNTSANYPCYGTGPNPWSTVYAFGCNGDGTLMYPSTGTYVTTSSNIPIWVPSMRLKYYRDGEQDYEYEKYLTSHGQGSLVLAQIGTWMTNAYTFSTSPAALNAARMALGTAIHQLAYPPTPSTSHLTIRGNVTIRGQVTAR